MAPLWLWGGFLCLPAGSPACAQPTGAAPPARSLASESPLHFSWAGSPSRGSCLPSGLYTPWACAPKPLPWPPPAAPPGPSILDKQQGDPRRLVQEPCLSNTAGCKACLPLCPPALGQPWGGPPAPSSRQAASQTWGVQEAFGEGASKAALTQLSGRQDQEKGLLGKMGIEACTFSYGNATETTAKGLKRYKPTRRVRRQPEDTESQVASGPSKEARASSDGIGQAGWGRREVGWRCRRGPRGHVRGSRPCRESWRAQTQPLRSQLPHRRPNPGEARLVQAAPTVPRGALNTS